MNSSQKSVVRPFVWAPVGSVDYRGVIYTRFYTRSNLVWCPRNPRNPGIRGLNGLSRPGAVCVTMTLHLVHGTTVKIQGLTTNGLKRDL